MNVGRQLHTVCCQAHGFKRMLLKVVRFGHSAPPRNIDAQALHSVVCPVGGLRHGKIRKRYLFQAYPKDDGISLACLCVPCLAWPIREQNKPVALSL
jgi:hypothetical protein